MKFLLLTILITLVICHSSFSQAARGKRAIIREQCPEKSTQEECEAHAELKAEQKNNCARYRVSNGKIVWHSCGVRICVDAASGNKYRAMRKDLTKSYPDCCPKCSSKRCTTC